MTTPFSPTTCTFLRPTLSSTPRSGLTSTTSTPSRRSEVTEQEALAGLSCTNEASHKLEVATGLHLLEADALHHPEDSLYNNHAYQTVG